MAEAVEFYVTAIPHPSRPAGEQAEALFTALAAFLRRHQARLLHERIFTTAAAQLVIPPVRAAAYGDLADGVPPLVLTVPEGSGGAVTGVQIHAVCATGAPRVIRVGDAPCGRALSTAAGTYVALCGLAAPEAGAGTTQARAIFEKAEAALRSVGGDMRSAARTWVWLEGILSWYDDFNRVRNRFFVERGLLNGNPQHNYLPASTGIGVRSLGESRCAMDVVAVVGAGASVEYFAAAGNQQSAFDYGSAFSRSARAATPAGKTIYVSGTAAIDEAGRTRHVGDAVGQVETTMANVRAVLADMACTDADVVQAIAYSKTPEVEKVFLDRQGELGWPCLSVIGDVCRDDLLFELEATAFPGARPL